MFKYKITICIIILLQCIVSIGFGQNNLLVLKNGMQIPFQDKLGTKKIKKQNYYTVNDTLVKIEDVNYYYLDSIVYKNYNDKYLVKQQGDGAINVYAARGNKYFSVGDTGKIQKLNYTNLYYAINDDEGTLNILKKTDIKFSHTKQVFIASAFTISNGIFALSTFDEFSSGSFGRIPLFRTIYGIGSGFAGLASIPVFVVSGVKALSNPAQGKMIIAVREYNKNR